MIKKGFTLAEVLTTLMVIGVVAAMTIPTLMNSTNDQQLKVAYKKAMSVLGQGVQMMAAKEVQCQVTDDHTLAECFRKNVLSGTLVNSRNESSAAGANASDALSVVSTSDGLAYQFIYLGDGDEEFRTIEDICGDSATQFGSTAASYKGVGAKCLVVVDLNGFAKGAKQFPQLAMRQVGNIEETTGGSEQIPIYLSGNGVRPIYSNAFDNASKNYINKGYEYMYGTASKPVD